MTMYIDRDEFEHYPFEGIFYTVEKDESLPLDQQEEKKIIVLRTKCDIQEAQESESGGNITSSFDIFFPFDKNKGIHVKRGMTFEGNMYGLTVNGVVIGISPSQAGGCLCHISDKDV